MTSFETNKGEIQLLIEEKIKKNFPNSAFSIKNTSKKHIKHKHNVGGYETHFEISIESTKFFKLSRLERQKHLIKIIGNKIIDKIHSISFKLTTPNKEQS